MARRKRKVEIVLEVTPRAEMGWPCFHCAMPLAKCKKPAHGFARCCKKCKGPASH